MINRNTLETLQSLYDAECEKVAALQARVAEMERQLATAESFSSLTSDQVRHGDAMNAKLHAQVKELADALRAALPTLSDNAKDERLFWGDKHGIADEAEKVLAQVDTALAKLGEGSKS